MKTRKFLTLTRSRQIDALCWVLILAASLLARLYPVRSLPLPLRVGAAAVLLAMAEGTSIITESIFDNRFQYMDELRRMGADILVDGKVAVIQGGKPLTAAPVKAVDLRAGAALVIAGLAAKGTTEVEDIHHIERGYECIVDKLRHLGADIELVQQAEPGLRTAL